MAVLLAGILIGGGLVAVSGIIPIKASSGHWAITGWFLNFTKERSVATHTLGLKEPALDEPWLVLKGAGHYETGCRPCHGSPGLPHPRIAQEMTPPPPDLGLATLKWEPRELFYIVKHGIKFTGMPAWPASQRDDEVWAMVAFLREFPRLDTERYRCLALGENALTESVPMHDLEATEKAPQAVSHSCGRCHGVNGQGRESPAFPKLAGQKPDYLFASLQAFARGERHSGMMEPIAAGLSSEQMRELALYYGNLPAWPKSSLHAETAATIERGKSIARGGIPSHRVPTCAACHGPDTAPRNPIYPRLAGQHADYLVLQLKLFKAQQRGGTAYGHLMYHVAGGLTPDQMRDVACYYASLGVTPMAQ
ncbi:MAG: c-type cytochrome [Verrucomicrobiales bacterium]|nr:c-type cytochrome [Verrucomicrobiales bacterium]